MKTFNDYAATPAGKAVLGAEFTDRLEKDLVHHRDLERTEGVHARPLAERLPPQLAREPSPPNAKHGREAVARWWGAYLQWAESDAEVEP